MDSLDGDGSGGAGKDDTPIFNTPILQAANFGPHTQRKVRWVGGLVGQGRGDGLLLLLLLLQVVCDPCACPMKIWRTFKALQEHDGTLHYEAFEELLVQVGLIISGSRFRSQARLLNVHLLLPRSCW